jgi:chemotaxis protein CheX
MIQRGEIVEYVRSAAGEVFSTMLGMEIEAAPEHEDTAAPQISDGVMAFVGMAGSWTGTGVISCSASFACRICAHLLMTEADSVNEEVLDAVGEVTNMIVGNFKTRAEEHLGALGLSIPTVIYGRNFTSRSIGHTNWIVLPFQCGGELLEVRICMAPAKEPAAPRAGFSHAPTVLA